MGTDLSISPAKDPNNLSWINDVDTVDGNQCRNRLADAFKCFAFWDAQIVLSRVRTQESLSVYISDLDVYPEGTTKVGVGVSAEAGRLIAEFSAAS